jgi:hypothetical protein
MQGINTIIEQFGFQKVLNSNESGIHPYANFSKEIDGINVDLTLITGPTYYSFNPIILHSGGMELCYFKNDTDYQDAIASGRIIVKAGKQFFELTLPTDYKNEFINACQFKAFPILKPDSKFHGYCFGISKCAEKLYKAGAFNQFNWEAQSSSGNSSDIIFYHELYPQLVKYYDEQYDMQLNQLKTHCYFELSKFIKKEIQPNAEHSAHALISPFYFSLISQHLNRTESNGLKKWNTKDRWTEDNIVEMASFCSTIFIKFYCMTDNNKDIHIDLKKETQNVVDYVMESYKIIQPFSAKKETYEYKSRCLIEFYNNSHTISQQSQIEFCKSPHTISQQSQYEYQGTLYPSRKNTKQGNTVNHNAKQQNNKNNKCSNRRFPNDFSRGGFG